MLLLSALIFIHWLVGQFLEVIKKRLISIVISVLTLIIVLYFTLGVRDTSDWDMYEYFYYSNWDKTDPMFLFLKEILTGYGYKFEIFFQLHITISTLSFFYLISRYTKNIFYVFFILIVLYYVPFVNQIRYYLAFPFFLLSIHYLLTDRKLILFFIFTALALTSHLAVIVLYGFLPLYFFVKNESFFKYILLITGVISVLVFILFQLGIIQKLEHFGSYAKQDMTSSVMGGIFASLPYFIYIFYLLIIDYNYRRSNPDYTDDKMYRFLSKISFFTIIFIPASFFMQVLGQRYVFPFLIFWVIFFLYLIRNKTPRAKFLYFMSFGAVHLIAGFTIYILPHYLFGTSFYEEELIRSIKSIKYLDYII